MKGNPSQPMNAFLGKDSQFEGKLFFTGTVRVDGRVKGEILSEGTLIVGDTAVLHSTVRVGRIIISGEVQGDVIAREKVELRVPGKVYGSIQSPVVSMEEGVIFEGACRMQKQAEKTGEKVAVLQQ